MRTLLIVGAIVAAYWLTVKLRVMLACYIGTTVFCS